MLSVEYVAGFFDGEGCIHLSAAPAYQRGVPYIRYVLSVVVGQQRPDVTIDLVNTFGGNVCSTLDRRRARPRSYHQWRLNGRCAGEFLRRIRPHLRYKAAEADIAIEFQGSIDFLRATNYPMKRGIPWFVHERRVELVKQLKALRRSYLEDNDDDTTDLQDHSG